MKLSREIPHGGVLIVNADDWGRDYNTTNRALECIMRGAISSVSAMVFMKDSERAAAIAREQHFDVGLHLNLTSPFSASGAPGCLRDHQQRLARFLQGNRFNQVVFNPRLTGSFEYVVATQLEEFSRLYGGGPDRIDGHQHMHLCANVLLGRLLPSGTVVRRNSCFPTGKKDLLNSVYRGFVDRILARRHQVVEYYFSLKPIEPVSRLQWIISLASRYVVELAVHPFREEEYRFLQDGEFLHLVGDCQIGQSLAAKSGTRRGVNITSHAGTSEISDLAQGMKTSELRHICVCVCTYKRPELLKRLLGELDTQETGGLFTYSVVVADNDRLRSAEAVVSRFAATSSLSIRYCIEPEQNIALARNKAIENATGDFVALIDDDEFPTKEWLLTLLNTCNEHGVDGVLGPVKPHFDQEPPEWITKGRFYERPIYSTGTVVRWMQGRTGNVLLKKQLFTAEEQPFRPEFRSGEDQDFFRRMIDKGHNFIWSYEAVAYEVVPPARCKAVYMLRKALLRGETTLLHPTSRAFEIAKSVIAVPVYTVALPFALLLGRHRFMDLLVRLFDHLGKLLALAGIRPIKEPYVTD